MSDNRTTELRAKLTERGIEWTANDHMGVCETSWNGFTVMQLTPNAKLTMVLTPEQAIAATLGCKSLTADDVLNAVYKHGARWQAIADELNAELGSERDAIYNAGFDNGVKATLQQLEGIMNDKWSSSLTKVENIEEWIDEQWKGYES